MLDVPSMMWATSDACLEFEFRFCRIIQGFVNSRWWVLAGRRGMHLVDLASFHFVAKVAQGFMTHVFLYRVRWRGGVRVRRGAS